MPTKKKMRGNKVFDDVMSLRKMMFSGWLYLLCITIGSWLLVSWSFAWAVLAGGIISVLSFFSGHKDVIGFIESVTPVQEGEEETTEKVKRSKTGFLIRFWFRIGLIGVALLVLIKYGKANVFGLVLGLSTVVFTITVSALGVAKHYFFSGRR